MVSLLVLVSAGKQPSALNREVERDRLLGLIREAQLLVVAKESFSQYLKLGVVRPAERCGG